MFRKYEKTYHMDASGKFCLSKSDISDLLNGEVIVEEKMDGANVGIIRHKNGFHLQKRGSLVGQSEHEQFGFFHNWANYQNFDKIMNLPKGYTVYGELPIVAKRYTKKEYHRAKIVKPEFRKILDESDHWMKYSIRRNKLKDQS
jgi:ATP-dependent RNA circularization protein (DNA/RNA ligase family)